MTALSLLMAGRFDEAIQAYRKQLIDEPDDIGWVDGLAKSYCEKGDFSAALPLLERVHAYQKATNPDSPGQHLYLSCAYWCLDDRTRAIELMQKLCGGILNGSISMAPDQAGGATFGLVLHYMGVTAAGESSRDYALDYLTQLNVKYNKRPTLFRYPVQTVKHLLGELSFEDALEGATGARSLSAAHRVAEGNRSVKLALGVALFHDGAQRRAGRDESGCMGRMAEVFSLGYQTESIRWYLARHEVLQQAR